jgi:YfiH family protein
MRRYSADGLIFYRFEVLEALGLNHAVFTRRGGHSEGKFRSLNVSLSVGDDPERVRANRRLVEEALGLEGLASARQVHGRRHLLAEEPEEEDAPEPPEADILLSDRPGLGLMIKQADCQAVLLYEPERRALAVVHCGWRGSVAGVLGEAVARLGATFGARPEAMRAAVAPSLGPCCAEFRSWRQDLPEVFAQFRVANDHFDFWRLSTWQLTRAGLRPGHIEVSGICTRCSPEFYSYRREGLTGRFATVGAL